MASEEEAKTVGGSGEARLAWTATSGTSEESGVDDGSGGEAASGGATSEATIEDADRAGERGHHRAENREMEGVAGQQEKPAEDPPGEGETEGVPNAFGVAENPGGVAREWERGSSCCMASTPPEWKSCPGGTKPPE